MRAYPAAELPGPADASHGHYGAWRAATSLPAMVASLLLLLVLFGWLGDWEGLVLLGWLASGAAAFTRAGERFAVRVGCGFRTPTTTQARLLHPAWETALRRAGLDAGALDLYVHRTGELNEYAAGARSVAVTSGILRECAARRMGEDHLSAVLLHDLLTAPVTGPPETPAAGAV